MIVLFFVYIETELALHEGQIVRVVEHISGAEHEGWLYAQVDDAERAAAAAGGEEVREGFVPAAYLTMRDDDDDDR